MGVETNALFVFEQRRGIPILTLHGEIDWTNAERVRECLTQLEHASTNGAVVDLEHVPLALASVFGSISALADRMFMRGRTLVVVSPSNCFSSQVLRLLRYAHVITESVESAMALLETRPRTAKGVIEPSA